MKYGSVSGIWCRAACVRLRERIMEAANDHNPLERLLCSALNTRERIVSCTFLRLEL